jgi:ABC-type amino acid transport substrate-binding protein
MYPRRNHFLRLCVIALVLAVVSVACGESESSSTEPEVATTGSTAESSDVSEEFTGRLADVLERGTLRVGVAYYAPTSIETPEGDITGVDIDVTAMFAERLGVEVEYVPVGWDVIAAGVQSDRYDMTVTLVESEEREQVLDFSDPLYSVDQLFMVRSDSEFMTLEDINDPSVTAVVGAGSYGETVIDTYLPNVTKRKLTGITNVQTLAEVLTGRADVMVIETPFTTRRVRNRYGDDVRYIPDENNPLQSDPVAYGLPDGDTEFAEAIDAFLAEIRADGTIDALFDKYVVELLEPMDVSEAFTGRLADVLERGTLRVGVAYYAPTSIETPEGDITGVDIDVTAMFAERLGVEVEYVPVGWDVIAAGVQSDRYDMTVTLVESEEREQVLDFSDPLYSVDQLFMVRSDSEFMTLEDINDPSVTAVVGAGSYGETVIDTYLPNVTKRKLTGITNVQTLAEVLTGRADVMVIETPFTTRRVRNRYGDDVRYIPDENNPLQSDPVAYGLPDGDTEFAEAIDAFLAEIRADGTIDALFDKYVVELLEPLE